MKQFGHFMMTWWRFLFAASLLVGAHAEAESGSPLQKVITLMTSLQGQVIREGDAAQTVYRKYSAWCAKNSKDKQFEISEAVDELEQLQVTIDKAKSDQEEAQARVEELSGSIATDEQDLKAVSLIREKEKNEFEAMDQELTMTVDTIAKARSVLTKELQKAGLKKASGASFLQSPNKNMQLFVTSLGALVTTAQGISEDSRAQLMELLQTQQGDKQSESSETEDEATEDTFADDAESNSAAPKTPVYESKSNSILDILDQFEKEAKAAQRKQRNQEANRKQNFELLAGRLKDRIKTETKELDGSKKELAAAKEKEATATGRMGAVKRDLEEDRKFLKKLQQGCMDRASEFEIEVKTRSDELTALAQAKKTVQAVVFVQAAPQQEASPEFDSDLPADSFLQVGMKSEESSQTYALRTAGAAVVSRLKQLATDEHSRVLAQLSSRVAFTVKNMMKGGVTADPFKKVKDLVEGMITKLEKVQAEDAAQKKFCDKEMKESKDAKKDREGTIEALGSKIEEGVADVAKMNQQKIMLMQELKDIASSSGDMDALRLEEHGAYKKVTKELKEGLGAVQMALKILREFYSQDSGDSFIQDMGASMKSSSSSSSATGGGGGGTAIIGLLEVCESDFSKGLAEAESEEDQALGEYTQLAQEMKKEKAVKTKTVSLLGSEVARIKKKIAELTGDRTETQQELSALLEYLEKLTKQCVAQPESYHERAARRRREIEGLQQAMNILLSQDGQSSDE